MRKPSTSTVVAVIFALAEAFVIRPTISVIIILSVDIASEYLFQGIGIGAALALGYLSSWLIFKKWNAGFKVKIATAGSIVLVSFLLSYSVLYIIDHQPLAPYVM